MRIVAGRRWRGLFPSTSVFLEGDQKAGRRWGSLTPSLNCLRRESRRASVKPAAHSGQFTGLAFEPVVSSMTSMGITT